MNALRLLWHFCCNVNYYFILLSLLLSIVSFRFEDKYVRTKKETNIEHILASILTLVGCKRGRPIVKKEVNRMLRFTNSVFVLIMLFHSECLTSKCHHLFHAYIFVCRVHYVFLNIFSFLSFYSINRLSIEGLFQNIFTLIHAIHGAQMIAIVVYSIYYYV